MKIAIKAILLLGITAYLVWAVVRFASPTEKQVCTDVRISLSDSVPGSLVTVEYVQGILSKHHLSPKGMRISDINLKQIDSLICNAPYVSNSSSHYTSTGVLCIDVSPQRPVLHVLQSNGDEYFVADNGSVMPAGQTKPDLCLASGYLTRSFACRSLLPLASYIYADEFWNRQIEQIYVTSDRQIELVPRVGDHTVILGSVEHFREKLHRLKVFYEYGMPQVGWNKYRTINLAYDNQVVCTK